MNLTFAANLTKMIDAGLGREAAPPETFVAVGRTTEYSDLGPVPIASFETNVEAPLRALSVAMEPIQAGTGDPSPENVRPITGRTAVTATRAGKNLLTRTGETHAYLDSTGDIREYASGWLLSDYIRVAPSTQYTFNPNSTAGGSAKSWYFDANKNGISYIDSGESTFTTPDNCSFMRFSYREASTNVQLELGSIATPYEPYNGQTVTLQLGQTVYGGTVDVTTGEMVVDRAIATFDGTENWLMGVISYVKSDATDIYLNKSDMLRVNTGNTPMYGNCNQLAAAATSIWTSDGHANEFVFNTIQIHINIANNLVGITDPAQETIDTARDKVKAWLAAQYANGTPVTITYPLATPLTVQLTAQQITTLLGQNNVWSDGGDVSLTYGTIKYTEGY